MVVLVRAPARIAGNAKPTATATIAVRATALESGRFAVPESFAGLWRNPAYILAPSNRRYRVVRDRDADSLGDLAPGLSGAPKWHRGHRVAPMPHEVCRRGKYSYTVYRTEGSGT
ncbi:MAG: hypothetical protein Kow0056_08580 [Coriobacteriia bacterium]